MNTKYAIRIRYSTGDSFSSWNDETELAIRWSTADKAKAALAKIREVFILDHRRETVRNRDAAADLRKKLIEVTGCEKYSEGCMVFQTDDGEDQMLSCSWRGNFETLLCAEIIEVVDKPDDNELRFAPEDLPGGYFDEDED
jgi:hypothetical protein